MSAGVPPLGPSGGAVLLAAGSLATAAVAALASSPRRFRSGAVVGATLALALTLFLVVAPLTPGAVWLGLPLSMLPAFAIVDRERPAHAVRVALALGFLGSLVSFAIPLLPSTHGDGDLSLATQAGAMLAALPLLVRLGVFPFHLWLPVVVDEAPLPVAWLLAATPVVPMIAGHWLLPSDPRLAEAVAPWFVAIGVASALYGSILSLVQPRLRRVLAYLLVSQAGTMLTASALGFVHGDTGAWLATLAYGLPMGGLLALAVAIESRTGTDDTVRLGGLMTPAPHLGAAFLALGFAAVGFPGSLGFVAEDVMMHAVLDRHPWAGALLLLATALNAIAIFRCFQRVFLGPLPRTRLLDHVPDLVVRERVVVVVLAVVVMGAGLFPGPLVAFTQKASGGVAAHHGEHP